MRESHLNLKSTKGKTVGTYLGGARNEAQGGSSDRQAARSLGAASDLKRNVKSDYCDP